MAQIKTKKSIKLGDWNRVKVYRNNWAGYIQLNGGEEIHGRSKVQ